MMFSFMRQQVILMLVAVSYLTRLPAPSFKAFQPDWAAQSARYFPLVGVLVGLINAGIWWLASRWLPNAVSLGLMIAVSLLVTGAFHEDGFADTCDGFGGGSSTDRVLAIMKDSRIGAYGAIGIFTMLGLKWSGLAAVPAAALPLIVVSAHMWSRWCACGLICCLRYVRTGDDAKARAVAGALSPRSWLAGGLLGVLALFACFGAAHGLPRALEFRVMCTSIAAAGITAVIAAAYFRQRIGGYTGDCLGAVQQLTELAFLLAGLGALGPDRRLY
jgi:adenosylcobinamide-GDP ribazoletransferase